MSVRARSGPDADPAADGWVREDDAGFVGFVGPFWTRREAGGALRYAFRAEPRHANLVGIVQGGMLMTLADRGLGMAAWAAAGRVCVTIGFETQFVGAGRIGGWIELDTELVRRTRELVFMRGLVTAGGETLAACQGTWRALRDRPHPASGCA